MGIESMETEPQRKMRIENNPMKLNVVYKDVQARLVFIAFLRDHLDLKDSIDVAHPRNNPKDVQLEAFTEWNEKFAKKFGEYVESHEDDTITIGKREELDTLFEAVRTFH
jgi:hypothetical protein